eukprot:RCo010320
MVGFGLSWLMRGVVEAALCTDIALNFSFYGSLACGEDKCAHQRFVFDVVRPMMLYLKTCRLPRCSLSISLHVQRGVCAFFRYDNCNRWEERQLLDPSSLL